MSQCDPGENNVLVICGENRCLVSFIGGMTNLKRRIKERFSDITLQIKSEEWAGMFVDINPTKTFQKNV